MKLYLQIVVSLYLVLLLASANDRIDLWGLHHLDAFPEWLAYGAILVGLAAVWSPPALISRMFGNVVRMKLSRKAGAAILSLCAVCAVVLFFVGRSENLLLGDGFKRIDMIQKPLDFWPTEYVDLVMHRLLYQLIGSPEASYALIAAIAGLLFLGTVLIFVRGLNLDTPGSVAVYSMVVGIAQMQFFFGYPESYAIMTSFATLFLLFGYRNATRERYLRPAVLAFALSGVFHLSGWFLLPGMLYLLAVRAQLTGNRSYTVGSVAVLVLAMSLAVTYHLAFDGSQVFVPLVPDESNPYWMFSLNHLYDIANQLLLVAPLPLFVVIGAILKHGKDKSPPNRGVTFLLLCTAGAVVPLLAVDPVLGAVRDWDLLSLYAVPVVFLAGAMIASKIDSPSTRITIITASFAILIAHTAPWIISNTDRNASKDLLKRATAHDIHYSPDYRDGDLLTQWSYYLGYAYGDYEEMARAAGERVRAKPSHVGTIFMYAVGSYLSGNEEQLLWALDRLEDAPLRSPSNLDRILRIRLHLGDMDRLSASVAKAKERFPEETYVLTLEWVVENIDSNAQEVIASYDSVMATAPLRIVMDYAAINITLKRFEIAEDLLDRAAHFKGMDSVNRAYIAALQRRLERESVRR